MLQLWQIHVAEQMILDDLEANPGKYKDKKLSELTDTEDLNEENSIEYTKAYYKKTLVPKVILVSASPVTLYPVRCCGTYFLLSNLFAENKR